VTKKTTVCAALDWPKKLQNLIDAGADVNWRDERGFNALHLACSRCNLKSLQVLLKNNADPNAFVTEGAHAIHLLIGASQIWQDKGCVEEMLQLLLEKGIDINVRQNGPNGWTALHIATFHLKENLVKVLLANGANPNIEDLNDGSVALHMAARFDHLGIVKLLVKSGGEVDPENNNGSTPFALAKFLGSSEEILDILLANGAKEVKFLGEG